MATDLGIVIAESRDFPALKNDGLRRHYLSAALPAIPRILASVDRNAFGPSYGCCDRQYWHYRTAAFPSEMYQEAALPLALAYTQRLPGNTWYGEARLAEAAIAILRFSAKSAHADGSCDDYYPQERALGAAVFSLQAATETYRLLELDDRDLLKFFARRAAWIAEHDESGRLTNHHALSALALWRTSQLTQRPDLARAAISRLERVVAWQSPEGWFPEYEGADPGYQTVTIDCLAKFFREPGFEWLEEPLRRAVSFCRWFLHPDDSYAGCYGSRGTRHFYPHGMEILAGDHQHAATLVHGYLRSLAQETAAHFDDDRMYVHRIANLFEAYAEQAPHRQAPRERHEESNRRQKIFHEAGLFVLRDSTSHTVVSTARGGVFQHFRDKRATVDAGLIVEFDDGRVAVSQTHDLSTATDIVTAADSEAIRTITAMRMLNFVRFERATPLKQAALHTVMGTIGRWGRTAIRQFLQRRVISGGVSAPVRMTRGLEFLDADVAHAASRLRVTDTLELTDPKIRVRRLAFASDLQAAYTAAAETYQQSLRQPWQDYTSRAAEWNTARRIVIVREF
ncbi:MAG: hypothetical protein K8U03_15640 [Planctomycetia bacterium]|nr:hypothetical protein [Planctomycetia bacterium]